MDKTGGELTHVDEDGGVRMVDVSDKKVSRRIARARGRIALSSRTVDLVRRNAIAKGDVLAAARIAGIMAAKKASEIIPLCHNVFIENIEVELAVEDDGIAIEAVAVCTEKTGIEMEALTAVAASALAIWDMCKAVDSNMRIEAVYLVEKKKEAIGEER